MPTNDVSAANGQVRGGEVLRLGDLTPRTLTIEIEGREQPLKAWLVKTRRYPASVSAELDDARNEYINSQVRVDLQGQPVNPRLYRAARNILDHANTHDLTELVNNGILKGLIDDLSVSVAAVEMSSIRASQQAWETYLTRCLLAACPGLEHYEADLLGPDRMRILVAVGLFPESMLPTEADATANADGDAGGDDGDSATQQASAQAAADESHPESKAPVSTGERRGRGSRGSTT